MQGEWVDWRRRQFSYTGEELEYLLLQYWYAAAGTWEDAAERRFEYDDAGKLIRKTFRRAVTIGQGLMNSRRWTYNYDAEGNRSEVLFQRGQGSGWEEVSRQRWTYNTEDRIETQTLQRRNGGAWENARRRAWTYDENSGKLQTVTEQFWSTEEVAWINHARRNYAAGDKGRWSAVLRQNWDADNEQWINEERELFDYTGGSRMNTRIQQDWDGSAWKNRFRGKYRLEGREMNALFETSATGGDDWTMDSRYQVIYNEEFRQELSQGWQAWNDETSTWENSELTGRMRNFWSEQVVSSTDAPIVEQNICSIPNPYRLGTPFFCPRLAERGQYSLRVYNLVGQPVYQQQISESASVTISGPIPPGMYLLHWREDESTQFVQKLIIAEN